MVCNNVMCQLVVMHVKGCEGYDLQATLNTSPTPRPAITDRQDYLTTTASPHHHDTAAGLCAGGCIEVVINVKSGRCMLLCNKCGAEVGFGERREQPAFILQNDAVQFLMGVKS